MYSAFHFLQVFVLSASNSSYGFCQISVQRCNPNFFLQSQVMTSLLLYRRLHPLTIFAVRYFPALILTS
jgi:hypothetical protein